MNRCHDPNPGEGTIIKLSVHSVAELITVASAVSFLLSVVGQELLFIAWGLDFTALASAEDAIMGGIRFLTMYLFIALLTLGLFLCFRLREQTAPEVRVLNRARIVRVAMLAILAVVGAAGPFTFAVFLQSHSLTLLEWITYLVWLLPLTAALVVIILTDNLGRTQIMAAVRCIRSPAAAFPLITALFATLVLSSLWGYPNLSLVEPKQYPTGCTQSIYVLWIGSRAILLECGGSRYVIMRGEESLPLRVG